MEGILYFGGIANEHIKRDRGILSNGFNKIKQVLNSKVRGPREMTQGKELWLLQ